MLGETGADTRALESADHLDTQFIQHGSLGVATGQGFSTYPNPAFAQPGFA